MIKTFDLRGRERPLTIYGPPGLHVLLGGLRPIIGRTRYPLELAELEPYEEIRFGTFLISPFPVKHRIDAYGYAFIEDDRPGRFDVEAARALGVADGPDFGRLQRGETVNGVRPEQVMGETRSGRRVVLSGDTAPCQAVEVLAHDADLLVHEATFMEEDRARARETFHTTAYQAAEIARDAGVRLLALTHLSTRYFPRDIREEARAVFANTVVPRDFDEIAVPFPERGEPALVKPEPEPEPAAVP
jgi:ribonuclease Z